jgi:hypothetical protein
MAQVILKGRQQVEHEPRAGRPSTSATDDNVERVRFLVRSDLRLTFRMINIELSLNRFTVHQITGFGNEKAPHVSTVSINEFLTDKGIPVVPQLPNRLISVLMTSFYSPGSKTT